MKTMTVQITVGFTLQKVYIRRDGTERYIVSDKVKTFMYNEECELFFEDGDSTKAGFSYIPVNGQKTYSLKAGYKTRYIVKRILECIEFETLENEDLEEDLDEDFLW